MDKKTIQNRKSQNIVVVIHEADEAKGLAFVMHGLSGNKEEQHIQTFAQTFIDNGYTTVLFDTTNTFGESDGSYENATVTNYYEDLEDVITWAKSQGWYKEPFCLVAHSLGGLCIALYAEKHLGEVKALAPISTVVSWELSAETKKDFLEKWERTGWHEADSPLSPDGKKRLKWSHVEDRMKYDLLPEADKLTMPVLMIIGSKDTSTPPEHQKFLFDALPGKKEIHIIEGAPHVFEKKEHLEEIKSILNKWIDSLN